MQLVRPQFLLAIFLANLFHHSNAFAVSVRPKRITQTEFFGGRFLWGECRLTQDPETTNTMSIWPFLCFKGHASSTSLFNSSNADESFLGSHLVGYLGTHFLPWVSWHTQGVRRKYLDLLDSDFEPIDGRHVEKNFIRFGNSGLHHVRADLGVMPMPYGLNEQVLPQIFYEQLKTYRYWAGPQHVAKVEYDNLFDTTFEIATAQDVLPWTQTAIRPKTNDHARSVRLSHDLAALGGTRISLFAMELREQDQRYGASILNISSKGATTALEWQRLLPENEGVSFYQLFRLNFSGPYEREMRAIVEYEDSRHDYWMFSMGSDFFIPDYGAFRFAGSYFSNRQSDYYSGFLLSLGVQLTI
jgi:hypothetical protein